MRCSISSRFILASLASVVVVGLAACGPEDSGGGGGGEGDFFEDVFGEDGVLDGGDDGDAGEGEGEGEGPAVDYVADTVNTMAGDEAVVFTGATGRWRSDVNGTLVGGARIEENGAESIAVRFDGDGPGSYSCATDALVSYNARDDSGAATPYSTRPEGASCSVVVETYDDVGGRIRGYFDGTLIDAAGGTLEMAGAFDVERLDDQ